jgi:homospermidine synthase
MEKIQFAGKFLFVGFGSITSGTLPLLFKHINIPADRVQIIAASTLYQACAQSFGVKYIQITLTEENCRHVIVNQIGLSNGDFLVNLSVDVSSLELIKICQSIGALYLDTCIEPWLGGYLNATWYQRSNYALRNEVLQYASNCHGGPTAILAHGANPGLVNHFLKRALSQLSEIINGIKSSPKTQVGWATLAKQLGVKVIQISERDTQQPKIQKDRNEFVNTWSVDGFVSEAVHQPSEIGWGSHEKIYPDGAHLHQSGPRCSIYLDKSGSQVKVRGWTPLEGSYHGFAVTHNETISIADYLTLKDENGNVVYRPTSFYCYHPCDAAVLSIHEILGRGKDQNTFRLLLADDIIDGIDELGILLIGDFGPGFTGYWHGSRLEHENAIKIPFNQATTLQVTAGVLAGIIWAIENPNEGIIEPDQADYERVLEITDPYTAPNVSVRTNWIPGNMDFQFSSFVVD